MIQGLAVLRLPCPAYCVKLTTHHETPRPSKSCTRERGSTTSSALQRLLARDHTINDTVRVGLRRVDLSVLASVFQLFEPVQIYACQPSMPRAKAMLHLLISK